MMFSRRSKQRMLQTRVLVLGSPGHVDVPDVPAGWGGRTRWVVLHPARSVVVRFRTIGAPRG